MSICAYEDMGFICSCKPIFRQKQWLQSELNKIQSPLLCLSLATLKATALSRRNPQLAIGKRRFSATYAHGGLFREFTELVFVLVTIVLFNRLQ